tara:strand:+ start:67006 stop:67431 length:426 start_codon:yes stop_codon:yes gene_type:complete
MLKPYPIISPQISTGNIYHFNTQYGVVYEVRFGRKENNILHVNLVFGVTNEEYDGEEYVLTNKGDVFRVMTTIAEIVKIYLEKHPHTQIFEFTAENSTLTKDEAQKRLKLYGRYIPKVFDSNQWKIVKKDDTVQIIKKNKY